MDEIGTYYVLYLQDKLLWRHCKGKDRIAVVNWSKPVHLCDIMLEKVIFWWEIWVQKHACNRCEIMEGIGAKLTLILMDVECNSYTFYAMKGFIVH